MPDYNPGLLYQGVQNTLDKYDQLTQNAKVADAMVKANPDLVQRMGFDSPEHFQSLSAQDKIAATTGYIKNQGAQEMMARLQDYQAQANERNQRVQDDQSIGTFLQNYGNAPETVPGADGQDQPLSPDQKLKWALTNTPGMSGRNIPRAIDSLTKWQAASSEVGNLKKTGFFKQDDLGQEIPGLPGVIRVPTGPNTSELRDKNGNQVTTLTDDEGKVIGYGIGNGKGGMKFTGGPKTGTVKVTDMSDIMNPKVLELPIEEAERRGLIPSAKTGGGTSGSTGTPKGNSRFTVQEVGAAPAAPAATAPSTASAGPATLPLPPAMSDIPAPQDSGPQQSTTRPVNRRGLSPQQLAANMQPQIDAQTQLVKRVAATKGVNSGVYAQAYSDLVALHRQAQSLQQ